MRMSIRVEFTHITTYARLPPLLGSLYDGAGVDTDEVSRQAHFAAGVMPLAQEAANAGLTDASQSNRGRCRYCSDMR